jgi:hypothetical protein
MARHLPCKDVRGSADISAWTDELRPSEYDEAQRIAEGLGVEPADKARSPRMH